MSLRGFRSLLAVLDRGFEPAGVAMGAASYQIVRPTGCRGFGFKTTSEPSVFPAYEKALRTAWQMAIDRLEADARRVGAHGVVGVGVAQQAQTATQPFMVRLTGSAVRVRRSASLARPFLSMLSMEDMLKLLLAGWIPTGIAIGISAVHAHGWGASPFTQGSAFTNAEMVAPTAGMQLAQARATAEARSALRACRATGMVGATVALDRHVQECGGGTVGGGQGVLIEGRVFGTGVVRYRASAAPIRAVRDLAEVTR